uniref:Uncharacterized protein n=1 Tax=Fagus sylvatica TaxID=28930 RepID=A0A2N9IXU2_FAGSY
MPIWCYGGAVGFERSRFGAVEEPWRMVKAKPIGVDLEQTRGSCAVGENLWVVVGEWVVNGGGGFVGCQWRRWRSGEVSPDLEPPRDGEFFSKQTPRERRESLDCDGEEEATVTMKEREKAKSRDREFFPKQMPRERRESLDRAGEEEAAVTMKEREKAGSEGGRKRG